MAVPPTVLVHVGVEAPGQAAGAALVAVGLVDGAAALQLALRLARVHAALVDAALEEPRAPCNNGEDAPGLVIHSCIYLFIYL